MIKVSIVEYIVKVTANHSIYFGSTGQSVSIIEIDLMRLQCTMHIYTRNYYVIRRSRRNTRIFAGVKRRTVLKLSLRKHLNTTILVVLIYRVFEPFAFGIRIT